MPSDSPAAGAAPAAGDPTTAAGERLRSFVERIERLNAEKRDLAQTVAEAFAEAKAAGFDVPALRQIIRERALDPALRAEHASILDLYRHALGMLADLPLGIAALEAAKKRAAPPSARRQRIDQARIAAGGRPNPRLTLNPTLNPGVQP